MSLRIPAREVERIQAHLCRAYPEEGCGVLLGRERDGTRAVERAIALENRRESSRHQRYVIAPEQFLAADREARAAGLEVVGFFHSHPDHPVAASAFDLEHAWPYYSYLIASVREGRVTEMRAFRLREDRSRFDPEPLELLPIGATAAPGEVGEGR